MVSTIDLFARVPEMADGGLARATALQRQKKQGATGITTVAPYIAGQWGRGE